jgi:hypothetical protein
MNPLLIQDLEIRDLPSWFVGGAEGKPSYYAPLQPYDSALISTNFKITGTLEDAVKLIQSELDKITGLKTTFCSSESLWNLTYMNGFMHLEADLRLYRTFTLDDGFTHIVEFIRLTGDAWKCAVIFKSIEQLFYPLEEPEPEPEPLAPFLQEADLADWKKKIGMPETDVFQFHIPTEEDIKRECLTVLQNGRYQPVLDTLPVVASYYCEDELPPLTEQDKECILILLNLIENPPFESAWPGRYSIHILADMSRDKEYCLEIMRSFKDISTSDADLKERLKRMLLEDEVCLEDTQRKTMEILQNIALYE